MEMLHKSSLVRCRELLHMQCHVSIQLYNEMSNNYLLNSRYISVHEQVTMFLLTIGYNCHNFLVQDVFQHSGEMVSCHFHTILHAFASFAGEMIKLPPFDETSSQILKNMKYYPWFKDYIEAIEMDTFMSSHVISEIDTFCDNLAALMQRTLERILPCDGFCLLYC